MKKLSIIVPCYNEEDMLPLLFEELLQVLKKMDYLTHEIIFVNDGSTDNTLTLIKNFCEKDKSCKYIDLSRNFGKEACMYAGLQNSVGDFCVIMDADLQHPPALLPEMYKAIEEEGYDCCGGIRKGRQGEGLIRKWASKAFYFVSKKLTKLDIEDGQGDFRMMKRIMVEAILNMEEYNRYMKGLFSFVGFHTKWIQFENIERKKGVTKWNFKNLISYAFEGILAFSTSPLKISGIIGSLFVLGGLGFFTFSLLQPLWTPYHLSKMDIIGSALVFTSGLQMLLIYIMGQYVAKGYLENKKRPVYIVRDKSKNL